VHEIFTNINDIKEPGCYYKCEELSFEIKKSDNLGLYAFLNLLVEREWLHPCNLRLQVSRHIRGEKIRFTSGNKNFN